MTALAKTVIILAGAALFLTLGTGAAFAGEPNPAPGGDEGNGNSFTTPGFTIEVLQPHDYDDPEEYVVPPDEQVFPDDGEILPAGAADAPEGAIPGAGAAGAVDPVDTEDQGGAVDQNLADSDATGNADVADLADEASADHLDNQSVANGALVQPSTDSSTKHNSGSGSDSRFTNPDSSSAPGSSSASSTLDNGLTLNTFTLALLVIVAAVAASMALGARQIISRLRHS